jgi:hypothetical protein
MRKAALVCALSVGIGACTPEIVPVTGRDLTVAPTQSLPGWAALAAGDEAYVRLRYRFENPPEGKEAICAESLVGRLAGQHAALAVSVVIPGNPGLPLPVFAITRTDPNSESGYRCVGGAEPAGFLIPWTRLSVVPEYWPTRQSARTEYDNQLADMGAKAAAFASMFTSGGNPIVGGIAAAAIDTRVTDLTTFIQNVLNSQVDSAGTLYPNGFEHALRNGRTQAVLPLRIRRPGLFSRGEAEEAGQVVIFAELRRSLFAEDKDDVPDFSSVRLLDSQMVMVPGHSDRTPLAHALDPRGLSSSEQLAERARHVQASALALRNFCGQVNAATTRLSFTKYDALAIKLELLQRTPAWSDRNGARWVQQAGPECFDSADRALLRKMGLNPAPG